MTWLKFLFQFGMDDGFTSTNYAESMSVLYVMARIRIAVVIMELISLQNRTIVRSVVQKWMVIWMNDRTKEKLVELLREAPYNIFGNKLGNCYFDSCLKLIADHLITNGVTVHEWISVEDELPEIGGYVVCIAKRNPFSRFMPMVARIEKNGWVNPMTEQYISEVTHWIPMPNLPKGE